MTILTPTKARGATTKPLPDIYVEASQQTTDTELDALFDDTGFNGAFVADLLSAMVTHERCGRHLYRSVAGRTNNPVLRAKYEEFGKDTERHIEILEELIVTAGGNPAYVSPMARATEGMDSKLLESTFLLRGSLDVMTAEMAMLDGVFLAETIDHANWSTLAELVQHLPDGAIRTSMEGAVAEVEEQEDKHLSWARDTKARLVTMQARSAVGTVVAAKAEEMIARVREWFSD
jgi:rubrerythrin